MCYAGRTPRNNNLDFRPWGGHFSIFHYSEYWKSRPWSAVELHESLSHPFFGKPVRLCYYLLFLLFLTVILSVSLATLDFCLKFCPQLFCNLHIDVVAAKSHIVFSFLNLQMLQSSRYYPLFELVTLRGSQREQCFPSNKCLSTGTATEAPLPSSLCTKSIIKPSILPFFMPFTMLDAEACLTTTRYVLHAITKHFSVDISGIMYSTTQHKFTFFFTRFQRLLSFDVIIFTFGIGACLIVELDILL